LIHERGEGSESPGGTIYVRALDGPAAVRLAAGAAFSFSPDNLFVLGLNGPTKMIMVPVRAGTVRKFDYSQFKNIGALGFLPGGEQFLVVGVDKDGQNEVYFQAINGGNLRRTGIKNFQMVTNESVSPDGQFLIGRDSAGTSKIYPLDGTAQISISGMEQNERPIQWNRTSDAVFAYDDQVLPAKVYRIGISDGRRALFKEIMPPDRAGVTRVSTIRISADEKSYAYTYTRRAGALYLLDGVR
jgi:hypothetical protein